MLYLDAYDSGMNYLMLYARDLISINPHLTAEQLLGELQKVANRSGISAIPRHQSEPVVEPPTTKTKAIPTKKGEKLFTEEAWKEEALKLYDEGKGMSQGAIADKLGLKRGKVYNYIYNLMRAKGLNKKRKAPRRTPDEMVTLRQALINLDAEGVPANEMAKRFKMETTRVKEHLAMAKIAGIQPSHPQEM